MKFPGRFPPKTAAQRQAKCRAIKRGEWQTIPGTPCESPAAFALPSSQRMPALPAPAPPSTAIQKSLSSDGTSLALLNGGEESGGAPPRLCLPAAVAARLRSLLDKHKAGKTLTAAERAEAEGLLDIAEYFAVQRLRQQLAA
jgi:hypothetical protein